MILTDLNVDSFLCNVMKSIYGIEGVTQNDMNLPKGGPIFIQSNEVDWIIMFDNLHKNLFYYTLQSLTGRSTNCNFDFMGLQYLRSNFIYTFYSVKLTLVPKSHKA